MTKPIRSIEEINEKIKRKKAVVFDAEEVIGLVEEKGVEKAAQEVDVVTTGTFGPMCSSGAYFNVGHSHPKCKFSKAWFNDVAAYAGLAAVDLYIGASELPAHDPANEVFPGEFKYGGAHVIEDLLRGREIDFKGVGYGTDCYPSKEVHTKVTLADLNEAVLLNPRNGYQNYNVAVNRDSERVIYTYMGILRPNMDNANYCSAGQLSPLLCDPLYRHIGIGTRIFLGGGDGYVYYQGTQHNPGAPRGDNGVPRSPAGTLAVTGDLKQMSADLLRGTSLTGYGVSLTVGIGIPLPITDVETLRYAAVKDEDLCAQVVDYSTDYPQGISQSLGEVTYQQLKSGTIEVDGKQIPTSGLSSYAKAKEIASILKERIQKGEFALTKAVAPIPGPESTLTHKQLKRAAV